jgi:hypothetical protein
MPENTKIEVDSELYIRSENENKVMNVINYILDTNSEISKNFSKEMSGIDYFEDYTEINNQKAALFYYLSFEKGKESEFGNFLSKKFSNITVTIISTNPDINYCSETVFCDGKVIETEESKFSEKYPDIYQDYLEDK